MSWPGPSARSWPAAPLRSTRPAAGVAVHAAAGLLAEQRIGTAGVLASDIARLLPEAITVLRSGSPG